MVTVNKITALWFFKGGIPWSDPSNNQWIKYRDIEMQIIEEAFQQGKSHVLLDKYRIDLKEFIQFKRSDSSKQRPVLRREGTDQQECIREDRFFSPPTLRPAPSHRDEQAWCPFLNEWYKLPVGRKALFDFRSAIDLCINGIIEEAIKHESDSETEAKWMAEKLEECKTKAKHDATEFCVHLYTRESFLYKVLNMALRNVDQSKLHTLGPFCFLIREYLRYRASFVGTVYRGVYLTSDHIRSYKEAVGTWRSWSSYTSTSKRRKMSEIRGNTLFIIEIMDAELSPQRAFDLSAISQFPEEEEVLLLAGTSFQIMSVEQDYQQKYIIQIKL